MNRISIGPDCRRGPETEAASYGVSGHRTDAILATLAAESASPVAIAARLVGRTILNGEPSSEYAKQSIAAAVSGMNDLGAAYGSITQGANHLFAALDALGNSRSHAVYIDNDALHVTPAVLRLALTPIGDSRMTAAPQPELNRHRRRAAERDARIEWRRRK